MATFAVTNATVYTGGYDLSSDSSKLTMNVKVDELDDTAFGDSAHSRIGGLRDVDVSHEGHLSYADPDSTLYGNIGNQRVMSITPTGADGATAYSLNVTKFDYTPLDAGVGDLAHFSGTATASDGVGVVRGQLLLPKTTLSGTTTGTGQNMGLVGATQKLYTAIHVFTAGTTATVIVESDDNSGFTSAVTRSTTVVTATGGTWVAPVSGAIATDNFWRVRVTTVTGSFSIAVAVAIQ